MSDFFVTPWTVAHQASLSMGFPRQEYWSELPFPSPGDPPDPGIESMSPPLAGGFFTTEPPEKALYLSKHKQILFTYSLTIELCHTWYRESGEVLEIPFC